MDKWLGGWMDGWVDRWTDGWSDNRVGGWTDGWLHYNDPPGWCVQGGLWGLANSVMGSMALRLEGHQPGAAHKPPPARCATTSYLYTVIPVTSSAIPAGLWVQTEPPLRFVTCVSKPAV